MHNKTMVIDENPSVNPRVSFGDVIKYLPLIEEIITDVTTIVAGGQATLPPIKASVHGHPLTITVSSP